MTLNWFKMKVLSRINPSETYYKVSVKRTLNDQPVISGQSVTPAQIERLAKQGIPVSVPNADQFMFLDSGRDVPPELKVDADRNTLWEASQRAKHRIMTARRREKESLT